MMKSVVLVLLALLCLAQATHFRFGTIDWKIEDPAKPNEVTFTLSTVMRTAYFTEKGIAIKVGKNDLKLNIDPNEWWFGDSTSLASFNGIVDQVQADSFNAHFTVKHTYPVTTKAANYTCRWFSYARLSTLKNNADGNYVLSTLVTLYTAVPNWNSPRSSSLPIVSAIRNRINDINLLASDAEGAVKFSLSTPAEQGSGGSQGKIQNQPAGFSVVAFSDVKWDTTGLVTGLYNAQVKITDSHGAFVVLDFLLNLAEASTHPAPTFVSPSPADGSTLNIDSILGQTLSFQVVASSVVTTDVVTISAGSLPAGVVISAPSGKNPTTITVTWSSAVIRPPGTYTFTFAATNGFGTAELAFFVVVSALPTLAPVPPTATPMPPTATPMPPTATPVPPTATPMPPTVPAPFCGDNMCSMSENCATCPQDCNECPMVIYNRNTGMVVTATSFGIGATIHLTSYNDQIRPNQYQAWRYDNSNRRIQLWEHNDLILGAGPVAQKLAGTVRTIAWDFKGALANSTESPQVVHKFKLIPVPNTIWSYIQNEKLDGFGTFAKSSCLSAPYSKPTNAALKEVWGPNCKAGEYYVQHFRFWTYQCANGVKC